MSGLIDQLVGEIHNIHTVPGYFVMTDFGHHRDKRLSGAKPERLESLYDLYVNLRSSRQVCMHLRIARFLTLVFQAKPLAFQQLLFQISDGHAWHQDTAEPHFDYAGFASSYYQLPNLGQMIRPVSIWQFYD